MIEIFETCQTKSIAKQTNRDESLIIRSIIVHLQNLILMLVNFGDCTIQIKAVLRHEN